jgi:hypothetical protein
MSGDIAAPPSSRPKSWGHILESGFDTRIYPYRDLPTGSRRVVLEESLWHRYKPAVVCFLRDLDSEQRYRITVFRDPETAIYGTDGVDFSHLPTGTTLTVEIQQNRTGTFRIVGARP